MLLNRVLPGRRQLLNGLLIALVISLVITAAAIAGNMHFSSGGGTWSSPFQFDAVVVGVGNDTPWVDLELNGSILAFCQNKGGKEAPGQNYVDLTLTYASIAQMVDENGRATFSFAVPDPVLTAGSVSAIEAGCPNRNWTVSRYVPNTQIWEFVIANARAEQNGTILDSITLTCTATIKPNGTTSGTCVLPSN